MPQRRLPRAPSESVPPASFGEALSRVRSALELDEDVGSSRALLLRARKELGMTGEAAAQGTLRQQLQRVLDELGLVWETPRSPPAELPSSPDGAGDDAEKHKMMKLVQQMIVKHQRVLVERELAVDQQAVESEAKARLEAAVAAKESELQRLQGKIKEFTEAAKGQLHKKQQDLELQRAACAAALRARASRELRSRFFIAWVRRSVALLARDASANSGVGAYLRRFIGGDDATAAHRQHQHDTGWLTDKFRALVGTALGGYADPPREIFEQHDTDQDGHWSFFEFRSAVRTTALVTDLAMRDTELRRVFDSCDTAGAGLLTLEQLHSLLLPPPDHRDGTSSVSPRRRRLHPPSKNSTGAATLVTLRRAAASANRRLRQAEWAADSQRRLSVALRRWVSSCVSKRNARVRTNLMRHRQSDRLRQYVLTAWRRETKWQKRAESVVLRRVGARARRLIRATFGHWVSWRETLAVKRLAGALKVCQAERQKSREEKPPQAKEQKVKTQPKAAGREDGSSRRTGGGAVKERKQLQQRVAAADGEVRSLRRRSDSLAKALKASEAALRRSEGEVAELGVRLALAASLPPAAEGRPALRLELEPQDGSAKTKASPQRGGKGTGTGKGKAAMSAPNARPPTPDKNGRAGRRSDKPRKDAQLTLRPQGNSAGVGDEIEHPLRLSLSPVAARLCLSEDAKAPKRWACDVVTRNGISCSGFTWEFSQFGFVQVDPFADLKKRTGPEGCATSAKEALWHGEELDSALCAGSG